MKRFFITVVAVVCNVSVGLASGAVPDRRVLVSRDVDFYGSDLQSLFDTTYEACERACLAQPKCKAFTFNERSNSCFPKSEITDRQPYVGAWSAEIIETPGSLKTDANRRATDLTFLSSRDIDQAREQAQKLGSVHIGGGRSEIDALDASRTQQLNGNDVAAMRWMGVALNHSDAADQWLSYAVLSLDAAQTSNENTSRYKRRALSAAVNALLRTDIPALRADTLIVLARAFEANGRGRDAIPALRIAQALQPDWPEIETALDDVIGKHGFRVAESSVDTKSTAPRICATFSEALDDSVMDFSPYVRLPDDGLAVVANGNQLCVEGVRHGERYTLTLRAGLPASSGETLVKDITLTQFVRDRDPLIRFPGQGYVLPKSADAAIPIETVNVERVDLILRQISDRNLVQAIRENYIARPLSYWETRDLDRSLGEVIWQGEGITQGALNEDITTRLPIGDVIADLPTGIYALTARRPEQDIYDDMDHTQWFVLSDLGVTTYEGTDGLHVFVRALSSGDVLDDVTASLVARSNRVLGDVTLDDQGYASFAPGLIRGTGGAEPVMVVVRQGDADLTFLSLTGPAFDLSDRGVEGRSPAPAMDVFLTTERGAYRAGETIHATALLRDAVAHAVSDVPLTAILTRPDGVEYRRDVSTEDHSGGHVFAFALGQTVPRGAWRLEIKADPEAPALASQKVLVEDFLPERIDVSLSLPDGALRASDRAPLTIDAAYLFGAPGADLRVDGSVEIAAVSSVEGYKGFTFGRHTEQVSPQTNYFDAPRTDANGRTVTELPIEASKSDRPLEARVIASVYEGSGRPVERVMTRPLLPDQPIIGIKPLFDDVVPEGAEARLQVVALSPELEPEKMHVSWRMNRVTTRYQWYQKWGSWNWEPVTTRNTVAQGKSTLEGVGSDIAAYVEWGEYELIVESIDNPAIAASRAFHAGWYAPADTVKTPDVLQLSLDRPDYRAGDTAALRIVPRYAGKALITVVSNRLIDMQVVDVVEGENQIDLAVTEDWGAGAYVTATVLRPMDVAAGHNPARAMGVSYAAVDPGAKQLRATIETEPEADPRGVLAGKVRVDGVAVGDTAYVTVAAVDLGILNLTSFETPDPSDHYFGQRRLGMEIRDLYGRLINGMDGAMGQIRSGGDAGRNDSFDSPPPTEELVVYFTGPIPVGPDGTADFAFDIPSFNGTVRVMAIAWSGTGVGQAKADVLVRDPVVVTASLPRFLAPGDQSRLLLEFVHATGSAGQMDLDVVATGVTLAGRIPRTIDLDDQGKGALNLKVNADNIGDHAIRVRLTTPDGKQLVKDLTLAVRSNDPEVSVTQRFELAEGKTFALDENLFADLRPGSGSVVVTAGPLAQLNAPSLLRSLNRYPYGCTEQVTSQAMPLLYMGQVNQALGLGGQDVIQTRVDQAIERILTRQSSNGAFGLWRPGSGDLWLDAYVSDFLSRAKIEGFAVPNMAFRMAMDNLRNRVNFAPDFDKGGAEIAYALYVLAREGAASMGDLRYYADVKAEAFTTPLGAAQLGAALATYGDQTRADRMFVRAGAMLRRSDNSGARWRADYGTDLRDRAGVLSLALEAGSAVVDRQDLMRGLMQNRPYSTQEAVWTLRAANAMATDPTLTGLTMNGDPLDGPFVKPIEGDIAANPLSIRNVAAGATQITITTTGVPNYALEEGGYGYHLTRKYYAPDGEQVDPSQVKAGAQLVVVLDITPFDNAEGRLMVNDPLPAGFEIDNPNLVKQGELAGLEWLKTSATQHSEFRSDRFLSAIDMRGKPRTLAYRVRAVSTGDFHHPAATVEDMYRPQYRAHTASGRVRVVE